MWKSLSTVALSALAVRASLASAVPRATEQRDYIIIGGGPAGFVLAEELSKNSDKSVTLLEAGPDTAGVESIDVPGYAPNLLNTQYTWNFTSQPDSNLNGNTPDIAQGRGFGGGSAVNYLGACRGAPSVFDEWADISGDNGLRWNNLLSNFKSVFHYTEANVGYETNINGSAYGDGPIEITAPDDTLGFVLKLVKSWMSVLNIPHVDLNDGSAIGVASGTSTIRASNRTRSFAPQGFGWKLAGRSNVQVLPNAEATKINFQNKTANSVTYVDLTNGSNTTLSAKEIILAAGAINSPKLLMLSGVGPEEHLKSKGIDMVANISEIGKNLFDHHSAFMEFEVPYDIETIWQYTENSTFKAIAEKEYIKDGSGSLGVPNGAAFAVSRISDSVFEAVGDTFHPGLPADRGHLMFQYSSSTLQQTTPNVSVISPFVALGQPEAAGYLELASADYRDAPLIHSNYYGSKGDKAAILYGYKQLRKVVQNSAFAPVLGKEIYPGSNVTKDDDLWEAIAGGSQSFHHPLGTVALGTVVEGKTWRIRGLEGIRVVDSSTLSVMPTCHIMASVYAVAHHAAQLIKQQDS